MWQRYELKNRAKDMIRKCYLSAVIVCLISAFFQENFREVWDGGRQIYKEYL